ncbi:MAG: GNAT family N-acetyltransferase [Ruminococcaceae bacterium]|nr:GNAT family N-acetyltransferase [Oscillospiraceae bacterium]
MQLHIKKFGELTLEELYEILRHRAEIFVEEQACPYNDVDGLDINAYHVFLTDNDGMAAYLRVLDKGVQHEEVTIGRVIAVKRGQGLGAEIFKAGIKVAREKYGAKKIQIAAQCQARGFYEKFGFRQISEEFLDVGIAHIHMQLDCE